MCSITWFMNRYGCRCHLDMRTIVNNSTVAGSKLTGSFSGSFTGDGSGLTNIPDATDDYGISKSLGEIYNNNNLTIRTSCIGHENHKHGLLKL